MARLTERLEGQAMVKGCGSNCKYDDKYCLHHFEDCPTINDLIDKLADYEDAEEQGLLLRLPCKVGDTVYILVPMVSKESTYREEVISRFEMFADSIWLCFKNGLAKDIKQIGKTVFLTKEEASQKLAEMGGKA